MFFHKKHINKNDDIRNKFYEAATNELSLAREQINMLAKYNAEEKVLDFIKMISQRQTKHGQPHNPVYLIMSRAAREKFPYSIECKNVEKLNVWAAYKQASENSKGYEPLVVMKKNNHKTLVVLDAKKFIEIYQKSNLSKYG